MNDLTFHLYSPDKREQIKSETNRRKKIMKSRNQ